jgi:CDGSH-type Zn-finger protein/uncharacterized Fe-S cluster protein YjdI
MDQMTKPEPAVAPGVPSRELLLHMLYEAAELEHNLMCTYLYAAFSLKNGEGEGLTAAEADAVARWRRTIIDIAVGEMGHLAAVWNITSGLGGVPRFGRGNFPLDIGYLPASVVVKLAPFDLATLQHFIYLERPEDSREPDGDGFVLERTFRRGASVPRVTPMAIDYETVGAFYAQLGANLRSFAERIGESAAFCGDPALQLSPAEVDLKGAERVICLKTALAAFDAIVAQGEGAPQHTADSHFQRFIAIRDEYLLLRERNASFAPAFPVAHNPVLRRPPRPEGRVWLEDEQAAASVDVANASYGLMLRLLAYAYSVPGPCAEKALAVDLANSLMRAVTSLGEYAARQPAGASNPECHAGMSFTTLRDASPFPVGAAARRFFVERLHELSAAASGLRTDADGRIDKAARLLAELAQRATREFAGVAAGPPQRVATTVETPAPAAVESSIVDGVEIVEGEHLTLEFEAKRCIHARFCVTGAPKVFLANVQGPWIHPDAMDAEALVAIAHACPSGAIRYQRKDGRPDESAPPVNLLSIREAGPYAVRADIRLDGQPVGYRATLCRCGASKSKPFCDGSHHEVGFSATGEPESGKTDMLDVRDGNLSIDPQTDGPLQVRGNLEIISGTGRVVARVQSARLCRCGASNTKPFCDGSHARVGFKSGV